MISLELPPTSIHKLTSLKTHRILHSLHTDMAASSLKYSITTREHVLLLKWFHPIFSRTRIVFFICSNTKCKHQCLISAKLDKVETSKTNCQLPRISLFFIAEPNQTSLPAVSWLPGLQYCVLKQHLFGWLGTHDTKGSHHLKNVAFYGIFPKLPDQWPGSQGCYCRVHR